MKPHLALAALAATVAVLLSAVAPASASGSVNFRNLFNLTSNAYSSLENIASTHNSFVMHHHSSCGAQVRKWWPAKARKDATTIVGIEKRTMEATSAQRKKPAYGDTLKALHALEHWTKTKIVPRVTSCKAMPGSSPTVDQDLSNVATDLGIGRY